MGSDPTYHLKGTLRDDMSLTFEHAHAFKSVFAHLVGKDLDIQVTLLRKTRSNRQNRYMHGVVVPTVQRWLTSLGHTDSEGMPFSHDQVYVKLRKDIGHRILVEELEGEQVVTISGNRFSKMDTKEFAEAIDTIIRAYAEKGCVIPEPNAECFLNDFTNEM